MEDETLFDRMNNACAALTEDTPERGKNLVQYWAEREGHDFHDLSEAMLGVAHRVIMTSLGENHLTQLMSGVGFGFMVGWELAKAEALAQRLEEK